MTLLFPSFPSWTAPAAGHHTAGRDTAWLDSSGNQAEVEDRQTWQGLGFVQMSKSRWDAGLDQAHDGKPHLAVVVGDRTLRIPLGNLAGACDLSFRSGWYHDAKPVAPRLE